MPDLAEFTASMKALDIQRGHSIVVYDQSGQGIFSSPRAAWLLRFFGVKDVRVLNGGLKKWQAEELPLVTGP